MAKLTTNDLTSLANEVSAVDTINGNFAAVEAALEKTLSRDGTTPNAMETDLDMNNNRIFNLPYAEELTDAVPYGQLAELIIGDIDLNIVVPDGSITDAKINSSSTLYKRVYSQYDTEAEFVAATIPSSITYVRTNGYSAVGDGGGHIKKKIVAPGSPAPHQKQSADGAWWEIVPNENGFNFLWFGAKADYNSGTRTGTDNTTPWQNFIYTLGETGKTGVVPAGSYYGISAPGTVADAALHNVKQVSYSTLVIKGSGSGNTKFVAKRAAGTAFPTTITSRPMLKSVSATYFELSGLTLDGGFLTRSETIGSLSTGSDPDSASLIEVRDASRVKLDDLVFTGFAQNWDNRTVEDGNYGRRGPLLVADCTNIDADIRLAHPTFREGVFFHNAVRANIKFEYNGPTDTSTNPVSTPLHIIGPDTDTVNLYHFRSTGAWTGSVCNIGGKDNIHVRNVFFKGSISNENDTTGDARTSSGTTTWGKGFDFGSEHQESLFTGHPKLRYLTVTDFHAEEAFSYALRGIKDSGTRGGHAVLKNINIYDSFEGVNFEEWERIDFDIKADRVLRYISGSSSNGYALRLVGVDKAMGKFTGHGAPTKSFGYPNATSPSVAATQVSRFGILLQRTNAQIKADTFDFRSAHILYEVAASGEDNLYTLDLDIGATTSTYTSSAEPSYKFIQLGRSGGSRRLKHCRLRGSIDGVTLSGHAEVAVEAVASNIA